MTTNTQTNSDNVSKLVEDLLNSATGGIKPRSSYDEFINCIPSDKQDLFNRIYDSGCFNPGPKLHPEFDNLADCLDYQSIRDVLVLSIKRTRAKAPAEVAKEYDERFSSLKSDSSNYKPMEFLATTAQILFDSVLKMNCPDGKSLTDTIYSSDMALFKDFLDLTLFSFYLHNAYMCKHGYTLSDVC